MDDGNFSNGSFCSLCCLHCKTDYLFYIDLAMFIPNGIFFIFLLYKLRRVQEKLASTKSPMFSAFYFLVYVVTISMVSKSLFSMTLLKMEAEFCVIIIRSLWAFTNFLMFFFELTILAFGLFFGYLDVRSSIRKMILVAFCASFLYITIKAFLMFSIETEKSDFALMIFRLVSSTLKTFIYISIDILPYTSLKRRVLLPSKRRFYYYCTALAAVNICIIIGASVALPNSAGSICDRYGSCVVVFAQVFYFSLYVPFVYACFLKGYASNQQGALLFSYKPQKDDLTAELPSSVMAASATEGFSRTGVSWGAGDSLGSSSFDDFLFQPDAAFCDQAATTDLNSPPVDWTISKDGDPFYSAHSTTTSSPRNPLYGQEASSKRGFYGELRFREDVSDFENKQPKDIKLRADLQHLQMKTKMPVTDQNEIV